MLYPVLTQSRLLSDLSGVWNFKLDNGKGFEEKWYEKPLKDADTMPVPASYNDLKEGTDFRDHYGWVFYQRNISVPAYVKSQRTVLRCAAVTENLLELGLSSLTIMRLVNQWRKQGVKVSFGSFFNIFLCCHILTLIY